MMEGQESHTHAFLFFAKMCLVMKHYCQHLQLDLRAYPKLSVSKLSGELSTMYTNNTESLTLWSTYKPTQTGLVNTHVVLCYRFLSQETHGLGTALPFRELMTLSFVSSVTLNVTKPVSYL